MKILLYDMGAYTQNDIMEKLENMNISFRNILYKLADTSGDAYFEKRVNELLESEQYDAVFSVNYYPVLAEICYTKKLPYLSWSYDSPLNVESMEETLEYETNYVFLFDREECRRYWKKGFSNVYHLPLAVNTDRLDKIQMSAEEERVYSADISMVGQLYESSLPELMATLEEYDKGYLTAIIEAQMRLYGCYFLPEVLPEGLVIPVAKHITHMERMLLLDILSESNNVQLYGPDKTEELGNVLWRGSAGYFDEMPRVFKASKINLNASLKCIQSGIPLRALDIMGSGGFLLTNYQPELAEYFVDGEELVMYSSLEDAIAKCEYYLEHEEERKQIAERGYQKVKALFNYEERLRSMFEVTGIW